MTAFHFYSPVAFEKWSWQNPDTVGIGGSETSHIELAIRLARRGHTVTSYSPLPPDCPNTFHGGVHWRDLADCDFAQPGVWLLYRCPSVLDQFDSDRRDQPTWLICQDVDYPAEWLAGAAGAQRQEQITRVVVLCEAQVEWTRRRYPAMASKVCVSSNGVKAELVADVLAEGHVRDPRHVVYTSSPDRALEPLKYIFTEARRYVPDLRLTVCYGFDNLDKSLARIEAAGDAAPVLQRRMAARHRETKRWLAETPGVTHLGRLPQPDVYRLWATAGVWVYAGRFCETSCVVGETEVSVAESGGVYWRTIESLVGREPFPVWSVDDGGRLAVSVAQNCRLTRRAAEVRRLTVCWYSADGQTTSVTLTPDHRVLTTASGTELAQELRWRNPLKHTTGQPDDRVYKPAGELQVGDRVQLVNRLPGEVTPSLRIGVVLANEPAGTADVYCMEVLPDHNFIANGIVVHNCISSMEAMSLGAIPIVCPVWAVGEHVHAVGRDAGLPGPAGIVIDDVVVATPANMMAGYVDDPLVLDRFVRAVVDVANSPEQQEALRRRVMPAAVARFDWERWVSQFEGWAREDVPA